MDRCGGMVRCRYFDLGMFGFHRVGEKPSRSNLFLVAASSSQKRSISMKIRALGITIYARYLVRTYARYRYVYCTLLIVEALNTPRPVFGCVPGFSPFSLPFCSKVRWHFIGTNPIPIISIHHHFH